MIFEWNAQRQKQHYNAHLFPHNVSLSSLNKKIRRHRETHLQSDRRVVLGGVSTHQAFLFTFLEFPKVVLYQEGGIELPHGYLIIWVNRPHKCFLCQQVTTHSTVGERRRDSSPPSSILLQKNAGPSPWDCRHPNQPQKILNPNYIHPSWWCIYCTSVCTTWNPSLCFRKNRRSNSLCCSCAWKVRSFTLYVCLILNRRISKNTHPTVLKLRKMTGVTYFLMLDY